MKRTSFFRSVCALAIPVAVRFAISLVVFHRKKWMQSLSA